jgi:hypothetical protein
MFRVRGLVLIILLNTRFPEATSHSIHSLRYVATFCNFKSGLQFSETVE